MGRIPCWRCNRLAGRLGSPASKREAGCPVQRMVGEEGGRAMLPWPGWLSELPQERCKWDKSYKRGFMRFCKRLSHLIVRVRGRISVSTRRLVQQTTVILWNSRGNNSCPRACVLHLLPYLALPYFSLKYSPLQLSNLCSVFLWRLGFEI